MQTAFIALHVRGTFVMSGTFVMFGTFVMSGTFVIKKKLRAQAGVEPAP